MYPIDMIKNQNRLNSLEFRISPFVADTVSNDTNQIVNDLVEYDEENNIYYYHLGSKQQSAKMQQLFFFTPRLVWPEFYTLILWIKWDDNQNKHCLTTFDSMNDVPVFVNSKNELGCASGEHGWKSLNNYTIKLNQWQFIVAFGGNKGQTTFYIGDLDSLPLYIGKVESDISNKSTLRIGNMNQGPGKLGSVLLYEGHLNMDIITDKYYETILEMGEPWTIQKKNQYKKELLSFVEIESISDIIIQCLSK